jgi:hypothetical protein
VRRVVEKAGMKLVRVVLCVLWGVHKLDQRPPRVFVDR